MRNCKILPSFDIYLLFFAPNGTLKGHLGGFLFEYINRPPWGCCCWRGFILGAGMYSFPGPRRWGSRNVDVERRGTVDKAQLATVLQTLSHGQRPPSDVVDAVFAAAANDQGVITGVPESALILVLLVPVPLWGCSSGSADFETFLCNVLFSRSPKHPLPPFPTTGLVYRACQMHSFCMRCWSNNFGRIL